jgi:glycosidase
MRRHPNLYEINALAYVNRLSAKYNERLTLASIPDREWQELARLGIDLVWMMGVWQRSPEARRLALASPGLRREFDRILPHWTPAQVGGSPYAIFGYRPDPALGRTDELARLKERLNRLGIGLMLDFVPNHLAMDHPWTVSNPERLVRGEPDDVAKHPEWFFRASANTYLAHGRDPYFAPWNDTAQVNFFSEDLREAMIAELCSVAEVADGVRCDMAMLALSDVFEWVWGATVRDHQRPAAEFWDLAIPRVKTARPDFTFMAEVYWGHEKTLQRMGFDFTYDKPLYDHLRWDPAQEVKTHLGDEGEALGHEAHFLENHDEPRAVEAFGRERSMAAAIVAGTLPGLRFYHDGQLEGKTVRTPVQLAEEPLESGDAEIAVFYRRLLEPANIDVFHSGRWEMIAADRAWAENDSHRNIMAWTWSLGTRRVIVAVNYSPGRSQAWLKPGAPADTGGRVTMEDNLTGTVYVREAGELATKGLYVDLRPFGAHIMYAASY